MAYQLCHLWQCCSWASALPSAHICLTSIHTYHGKREHQSHSSLYMFDRSIIIKPDTNDKVAWRQRSSVSSSRSDILSEWICRSTFVHRPRAVFTARNQSRSSWSQELYRRLTHSTSIHTAWARQHSFAQSILSPTLYLPRYRCITGSIHWHMVWSLLGMYPDLLFSTRVFPSTCSSAWPDNIDLHFSHLEPNIFLGEHTEWPSGKARNSRAGLYCERCTAFTAPRSSNDGRAEWG